MVPRNNGTHPEASSVSSTRRSPSGSECLSSCAIVALVCLFCVQLTVLLFLHHRNHQEDKHHDSIARGIGTEQFSDVDKAGEAIVLNPGQKCVVPVAKGQRAIGKDTGVQIDLGLYNDISDTQATIVRQPNDDSGLSGGIRSVYDIELAGHTAFDDPITITLPYDTANTDPENERGSVIAEYKNAQSGQWEVVPFRVNTSTHCVTITTDHLSEYCVATFKDANTPYAKIASLEACYLDDKLAGDILCEFGKNQKPGPAASSLTKQIWAGLLYTSTLLIATPPGSQNSEDVANDPAILNEYGDMLIGIGEDQYGLLNDVVGWLGDVGANTYDSFDPIAKLGNKMSNFTMNLSIASLCYSYINIFTGRTSEKEFRATLSSTAQAYLFGKTAWGTLKVANIAVIALDYSLKKFQAEADKQYKEGVYRAMIAYNEEMYPQSDKEWYRQLLKIYNHTKGHPNSAARFDAAVNYLLTARGQRFFEASYDEQSTAHKYAGVNFLTSAEPYHLESAREYCLEQYRARLGLQLQPVFERLCNRIAYEADMDKDKSVKALQDYLNAPLSFVVEEKVQAGQKPHYGSGSMVILRSRNGKKSGYFRLNPDKNGRAQLDCTVLGYLQNGMPQVMEVYKSSVSDQPEYATNFKVKGKTTRLIIPSSHTEKDNEADASIEETTEESEDTAPALPNKPFKVKILLVPETMRDFNVGERFGPLISLSSYQSERIAYAEKLIAQKNAGRSKPIPRTAGSVKEYYELIDNMKDNDKMRQLCGTVYTLNVMEGGKARLMSGSRGKYNPDSGFYGKECRGGTYDSGSQVFQGEGSCWEMPRGGTACLPAAVIMGKIEINLKLGTAKWDSRKFKVYQLDN